ncbi:MAG: SDR family NAD(P)-dependent oxidoreductase [Thermoplasmataceae archaeon]
MQETNPFLLNGKRVLVTGGSMGIGMGIVKRFVSSGAKVLIADKAVDPAHNYINSLPASVKDNVSVVEVDLMDQKSPEIMINTMVKLFGGIDVLINNAGIYPMVPMMEMKQELFDKVYAVNLKAAAFTCREAARQMVKQGSGGKIVVIASIDSIHPSAVGLAAYDASKGGVLMFTKNFALEVAKYGINVNAIAPGGIATEGSSLSTSLSKMTKEDIEKMTAGFIAQIPLGRMGIPDDIAKVTMFLASSAADYMTGTLVVVDGGRLLM